MSKEALQRYDRICEKCAKDNAGVCHKEIVCADAGICTICGKETNYRLSARDYGLPKANQEIFKEG